MPVTPLTSPVSPKNRASISPSSMPTPVSTEDRPPKPTCSATSKSRRQRSIRWSSPSNVEASSDGSHDSQGASRSSSLPKTCRSYDDPNSNRQNLCVTPLVLSSGIIDPIGRPSEVSGEARAPPRCRRIARRAQRRPGASEGRPQGRLSRPLAALAALDDAPASSSHRRLPRKRDKRSNGVENPAGQY